MTACRHAVLECDNTTPTGTPARCKVCGADIIIPPVRLSKANYKTIAGLSQGAKRRIELDVDLFHILALASEGMGGCRE